MSVLPRLHYIPRHISLPHILSLLTPLKYDDEYLNHRRFCGNVHRRSVCMQKKKGGKERGRQQTRLRPLCCHLPAILSRVDSPLPTLTPPPPSNLSNPIHRKKDPYGHIQHATLLRSTPSPAIVHHHHRTTTIASTRHCKTTTAGRFAFSRTWEPGRDGGLVDW